MLQISDKAGEELKKVMLSPQGKGNKLVIYFQGHG